MIGFSSYFNIKNVTVEDTELTNKELSAQVKETALSYINKNLIFFDTSVINEKLINDHRELQEVEIEKDYPNTLVIKIIEYPLTANIINESPNLKKTYIINSQGLVIKENLENKSLPYIRIKSDEPFNPKMEVMPPEKLNYILESMAYFKDKFGMRISEAEYKPIAREVHLSTEKNFNIWLDMQIPYETQFRKLKTALVKLDIYKENLQYIDLRIAGENGDKIIYKRR